MSTAITLHVYEEGSLFRAECEYPVVHVAGETEQEVISKAMIFIQEMLAEADHALLRDHPRTLIVHVSRAGEDSVRLQLLDVEHQIPPDGSA